MTDIRSIKAGEGRRVRHPGGKLLAEGGETVAWTSYWHRLLQDGDVVEIEKPEAPTAPETPKASAPKAAEPLKVS